MHYITKSFSIAVCIMSTVLMASCSQSSDQQANDFTNDFTITKSGSVVAFSNSKVSITDGENFTLDITASDLPASEGGAVTLNFDPALVQVVAVNIDSSTWSFVNKNGKIDNENGTVTDIIFSSYRGVSGDAVIATIEFKSINKGSSSISIEESSVNPFASNGELMTVLFETANVVAN